MSRSETEAHGIRIGIGIILLCSYLAYPVAADVLINEFMADNDETLLDGDGKYSDWIEIYNTGTSNVDLTGWYLSDDTNELDKWSFPSTNLAAGSYMVVFASGADSNNYIDSLGYLHTTFKLAKNDDGQHESVLLVATNGVTIQHGFIDYPEQSGDVSYGLPQDITVHTLIAEGEDAKALIPSGAVSGWTNVSYNDSGWLTGTTGAGYERDSGYESLIGLDIESMFNVNGSAYIRIEFEAGDPSVFDQLSLRMKYDDGFVAYLNGTKVASTNAPASPAWDSLATASHEADVDVYETFDISSFISSIQEGTNMLAIQALNTPLHSSDLIVLPELEAIETGGADTNSVMYFESPTPDAQNLTGIEGYVEDTTFSVDRGFYTNAFQVAITTETADAQIYYTLNGKEPSPGRGILYTNAITITNTTVLRAAAFKSGYAPTDIDTHTYIFVADVAVQSTNQPGPEWPPGPVNGQVFDYGMDPDVWGDSRYTNLVTEALLAIPTISLVTEPRYLFDPVTGIYVNAQQDGREWERPTSVELINPDGSEGFQVEGGLRIRGGMSRQPSNPKHSFRLFFRSEYGAAKLDYELFGDEGTERYDKIDLRTGQNFSWNLGFGFRGDNATWLYDIFNRDAHREMGQPYSRGRFYHLYINGHYWGLYQTDERPEANYGESYYGGSDEDYDTLKSDNDNGAIYATDGNLDGYSNLWAGVKYSGVGITNYFRLQGMNPDGSENTEFTRLLDVDNLIDYMLLVFYGGNRDMPLGPPNGDIQPRNLFALYNRENPDGVKFIVHDCEHSLEIDQGVYMDRVNLNLQPQFSNWTNFTPWWLHLQLISNTEYRVHFGDRVHKHFFNDGVLTPASVSNIWMSRAAEIETAIIAESARWGDYQTPSTPRTRDDDWLPAVNWLATNYFTASPETRTDIVVSQLRGKGWYPSLDAPIFSKHGGVVSNGFRVEMSASNDIYYTVDGSDPREMGSGVAVGDLYTNGVALTYNALVKARSKSGSDWSALTEALFVLDETSPLRVTEIMYHPAIPSGSETNYDRTDFEFIEVLNTGSNTIGLAGIVFTNGVRFDFTEGDVATLNPGAYAVVVSDFHAFTNRYTNWANIKIAGEYKGRFFLPGSLDNGGESIGLGVEETGETIQYFTYDDDWYPNTDGEGFSLTLLNPDADLSTWSSSGSWRPSAEVGGTPGAGPEDFWAPGDIVINETLTHQDQDEPGDWIELYNTSTNTVNLNGWYISDDEDNPTKVVLSGLGSITGGGYIVVTEYDHFGTNAVGTNGFALSEMGESVYLSSGTNGVLTGYRVSEVFGAADNSVTFGRYEKSDGSTDFTAMSTSTTNAENAYPLIGPIVISEVMYHPADSNAFEFIELYNIMSTNVPLYDPDYPSNTWLLSGAITFSFPTNTIIAATNYVLVIPTNESAFRLVYSDVPLDVMIYGPYDGKLDNNGENVELYKPGNPNGGTGDVPWILVDMMEYDDTAPWPEEADGGGSSLERRATDEYGNDATNWTVNFYSATPGMEPEDADFDGMPNGWETDMGLDPHNADGADGADGDPDTDELTNIEEFIALTDPNDHYNFFDVLECVRNDVGGGMRISWESATGRLYKVYEANAIEGVWSNTAQQAGNGMVQSYTNNVLIQNMLFRLSVELQ